MTDDEIRAARTERLDKAMEGCTTDEQRIIAYQRFVINELMEQNNLVVLDWCAAKQELFERTGSKGGFLA